jgi:hypothetical protein
MGNATINRPLAGRHGFSLPINCSLIGGGNQSGVPGSDAPVPRDSAGMYRVEVSCLHPDSGSWQALAGSPKCYSRAKSQPCRLHDEVESEW